MLRDFLAHLIEEVKEKRREARDTDRLHVASVLEELQQHLEELREEELEE